MSERRNRIHEITRLKEFEVPIANGKDLASCKSSSLNNLHSKVQVYVIGNQTYFGRMGVYADPVNHKEYTDNGERFGFFCRSVLETCKLLGWRPTIIHCNDWQTGLIPAYAKTLYSNDGFFMNTKFVYTIHNIQTQGEFDKSVFDVTELPKTAWSKDGVQHGKFINFMKAGIQYADVVTTVSSTYAKEVCERAGGYGLNEILAQRKKSRQFIGILNGIDHDIWTPSRDSNIPQKFSKDSVDDKVENKRVLCEKLRMEFSSDVPMIGFAGDFNDDKGLGLLLGMTNDLAKLNSQFVFIGKGNPKYQDTLTKLAKKHPDKFGVHVGVNDALTHLMYAGCDMVLVPSKTEPSGQSQLFGLRYGAVPIVHETGGLADSVVEFTGSKNNSGTGFVFQKFNSTELLKAIKRALTVWNNHDTWRKLQVNGMTKDFSWQASAEKYSDIYKAVLKKD
jgi:starch synthase